MISPKVQLPGGSGVPIAQDISFTYDVNGNVDTKTVGATVYTYTYDVDYNVDTISGGGYLKTFTYDVNGNVEDIDYTVI